MGSNAAPVITRVVTAVATSGMSEQARAGQRAVQGDTVGALNTSTYGLADPARFSDNRDTDTLFGSVAGGMTAKGTPEGGVVGTAMDAITKPSEPIAPVASLPQQTAALAEAVKRYKRSLIAGAGEIKEAAPTAKSSLSAAPLLGARPSYLGR